MDPYEHLSKLDPAIVGSDPLDLVMRVAAAIFRTSVMAVDEQGEAVFLPSARKFENEVERHRRAIAAVQKNLTGFRSCPPSRSDNPAFAAVMRQFEAPPGVDAEVHGAMVFELLRKVAELKPAPASRGGRPPADKLDQNAVRATMHYLHLQGMPYSGGWHYDDRDDGREHRRSNEGELFPKGPPAKLLVEVKIAFSLESDLAGIKGHHDRYVALLAKERRNPMSEDYIP